MITLESSTFLRPIVKTDFSITEGLTVRGKGLCCYGLAMGDCLVVVGRFHREYELGTIFNYEILVPTDPCFFLFPRNMHLIYFLIGVFRARDQPSEGNLFAGCIKIRIWGPLWLDRLARSGLLPIYVCEQKLLCMLRNWLFIRWVIVSSSFRVGFDFRISKLDLLSTENTHFHILCS